MSSWKPEVRCLCCYFPSLSSWLGVGWGAAAEILGAPCQGLWWTRDNQGTKARAFSWSAGAAADVKRWLVQGAPSLMLVGGGGAHPVCPWTQTLTLARS